MAKSPNAPSGGNRQGPKVAKQGKSGPIIGKMTSAAGKTAPWSLNKGTSKNLLKGNSHK